MNFSILFRDEFREISRETFIMRTRPFSYELGSADLKILRHIFGPFLTISTIFDHF